MGIAERETEADNAAFTDMAAVVVLRDAIHAAEKLGRTTNPEWSRIAESIVLPKEGGVIVSHDGFQPDEEKGGGFRREVQPRRQHWFLNEKSGFPFQTRAFCSVSEGQRRLGEEEYRARSVTPGVALRPELRENS